MTEKKTTTKEKFVGFVKKHEQDIILFASTTVIFAAGIVTHAAVSTILKDREWNTIENHEFFADADMITRSRDGKFFKIKEVDEEKYENA